MIEEIMSPWVRGLRGSNFYVGCVSSVGKNIFYVGHDFDVGYVSQICFCVGPNFFAWVFAWVKIFYTCPNFLRG